MNKTDNYLDKHRSRGTLYEDVKENIKSVEVVIRQKENDPDKELPISPPFLENMMSLAFVTFYMLIHNVIFKLIMKI